MRQRTFKLTKTIKSDPLEYIVEEKHFGAIWTLKIDTDHREIDVTLECKKDPELDIPYWTICADVTFQCNLPNDPKKIVFYNEFGTDSAEPTANRRFEDVDFPDDENVEFSFECLVAIRISYLPQDKKFMDFSTPNPPLTDVILKIEEKKFHVSKTLLAVKSPFFKALFYGNFVEAKQEEVVLEDVCGESFQELLEFIYGKVEIFPEDIDDILLMADKFDVPSVKALCELFLRHSDDVDNWEKVRYADMYQFDGLLKHVLEKIDTKDDLIRAVSLDSLSESSTFHALLIKSLEFSNEATCYNEDTPRGSKVHDYAFKFTKTLKKWGRNEGCYEQAEICGTKWVLSFDEENDDDETMLVLWCHRARKENENEDDEEAAPIIEQWEINADITYKIQSTGGFPLILQKFSHKFGSEEGSRVFTSFPDKERYGETITIECSVILKSISGISKPKLIDFSKPNPPMTDVILKIQQEQFHVLKGALAWKSQYFKDLFYGNVANLDISEYVLNDVEASDFQIFLEVIFGEKAICAENVESLLKLSTHYQTPIVKTLCEQYLLRTDDVTTKEKLRLADKYQLEDLLNDILDNTTTNNSLKDVIPPESTNFRSSTLVALLKKSMAL